jgi:transcriptional regulator with XRE-family HTH domain
MKDEQQSSSSQNISIKDKGGRRTKTLSKEDLVDLARLSKTCSQNQIADYFGISHATFIEIRKRQPEVDLVYKKGRTLAGEFVASRLIEAADKGNVAAMIFYLKTQFGWREKGESELDTDNELEYDKNPKVYVEFIEPKDNMKEVQEAGNE